MARLTEEARIRVLSDLRGTFGGSARKQELKTWAEKKNVPPPRWIWKDDTRKLEDGFFSLLDTPDTAPSAPAEPTEPMPALQAGAGLHTMVGEEVEKGAFIPKKDPTFIPFGAYEDIEKLIASKVFFPVYMTGLSGLGKTAMIIEACARLGREMVRLNITKDTDEIDLFGSYELINGNTVRNEGPVLTAMRRGAILLLDETDYGSERLLCLQSVLEGKPYLDKKTNTIVYPAPGFNIFATANTKGKGSSDGRFVGANVLNEAFLERFATTEECEYPPEDVERKIMRANFKNLGLDQDDDFINILTRWAAMIRKNYQNNEMTEIISTRRLVHIARSYAIYGSRQKAVTKCLNRFEEGVKTGFLELIKMLDDKFETGTPTTSSKARKSQAEKEQANKDFGSFGSTGAPMTNLPPQAAPPPPVTTTANAPLPTPKATSRSANEIPTDSELRSIQAELRVKFQRTIELSVFGGELHVSIPEGTGKIKKLVYPITTLPKGLRDLADAMYLVVKTVL